MSLAIAKDSSLRPADVAIVGSGPVGLKLALDLADAGMDVLLLESGLDRGDGASQALSDAEIASAKTHAPMAHAVKRAFGGTSNLWGGRAVPFDEIDFAARPYAAQVRWPLRFDDVAKWYEPACRFLDCGASEFEDSVFAADEAKGDGLKLGRLERWCAVANMARVHGERARKHPKLQIVFDATVLRVNIDAERGTANGLHVAIGGVRQRITARSYVIAAGGLETTRLLLASRMTRPSLFGGPDGALGRYYMGHIFGSIADIVFERPDVDAQFDFVRDTSNRYRRRRFTLDAQTQQGNQVLNMAAWPEPPPLDDARHGSGILSLAYLALRAPVLGRMLSPEAIRVRKAGTGPLHLRAHVANILKDGISASKSAAKFLHARYADSVRLPGFFIPNKAHRYSFYYHGEQLPNAASRARLSDRTDALGQPRLVIDLRFGAADAASIVKTHELMGRRMEALGIGRLEFKMPRSGRVGAVLEQASDGFHQIGTARMSTNELDGVVDGNARVHGVANLFLAGSAIFPSSGQANPTLTAVALAARLAAHLRNEQRALPEPLSALAS